MCSAKLVKKHTHHQLRNVCPDCGFIQFHDPKVAAIALVTRTFSGIEQVLLIQRAVDPEMGKWALPGGHVDGGEMPIDALKRELLEEVGLPIHVNELLDIFPLLNPDGSNNGIVLAYHAAPTNNEDGQDDFPLESNDDVSSAGWFTKSEIPDDLAFQSTHTLLEAWRLNS